MADPIKAISNVIELKEGKKYLLVFITDDDSAKMKMELLEVLEDLKSKGIVNVGIAMKPTDKLEIIEVPNQ